MTADPEAGVQAGGAVQPQNAEYVPDWLNDRDLPHGGIYVVRGPNGVHCTTSPFKEGWERAEKIAAALNAQKAGRQWSAADQKQIDGVCFEKVTVTHWRAIDEDTGGCAYSKSTRDAQPGVWPDDLKASVAEWCERFPRYHLEEWQQTYWVGESEWAPTARSPRPSRHDPMTCQDGHLGCESARDAHTKGQP